MSTGLECEFVELGTNEWYYFLQDWDCPAGAWDWLDYSTSYGPFDSYDIAHEHLRLNHANPGGHSIVEVSELNQDNIDAYRGYING